jgi:hypothetical protein
MTRRDALRRLDDGELRDRSRTLARSRQHFGCRRLHGLLAPGYEGGRVVNHTRLWRPSSQRLGKCRAGRKWASGTGRGPIRVGPWTFEADKPQPNAFVDSFTGRLLVPMRVGCLMATFDIDRGSRACDCGRIGSNLGASATYSRLERMIGRSVGT